MKIVVLAPHFAPDVAPTGAVVTRIVEELAARGHRVEVVTSLPWYRAHRIEPGYQGRLVRYEDTPWGRVVRVHPFPTSDKRNIARRAASFLGFTVLSTWCGIRGGRADAVVAVSPPLTLGLAGWVVARTRRARFVFNIQDVYPDVAVELGVLKSRQLIGLASALERFCYARADAVTVLSDDLLANISKKTDPSKVRVVPNFVDTEAIRPSDKENDYRKRFGLQGKFVVMYAGNVGLSQSLDLLVSAAVALQHEEDIVFVVNGEGAARSALEEQARDLHNVRFVDMQPEADLPEVLSAADIHIVPLRRGLARSSVPSKTYSILAAARPLIASVDEGSEVARVVERAGAGLAVPPEEAEALTKAITRLFEAPDEAAAMGRAGRRWVEGWASAEAVAGAYESLIEGLGNS